MEDPGGMDGEEDIVDGIQAMPMEKCHLVLWNRTIRSRPWKSLAQQGQTVSLLLKVSHMKEDNLVS